MTNQSIKIGCRAWPTRDRPRNHREKSQKQLFSLPVTAGWNFRVRGQFELKILIVRHINTTYFIWIFLKKLNLSLRLLQTNLSADNFKKYLTSMGRHLSPVILVSGYPVSTAVNWSKHWCPICVHYQFSCALAKKYEIEHCSRASKTINWSADSFQINHGTSMSWHMSPRYGHGILVSGYPVLTAVNWLYCECPI